MRLAPYDPNPTSDTELAYKPYHWYWKKLRNGKMRIALHRGPAKGCKRVHYTHAGARWGQS